MTSDVSCDIDLILRLFLVELNMQNHVCKFYAGFFRQSMGVLGLKYLVLIMMKWFLSIKVRLDVPSHLDLTIFKNGQIWSKNPKNGRLLNMSTLPAKNTKF